MFGNETTGELYNLFLNVVDCCLRDREGSRERVRRWMVDGLKD
jgi:hypothetical protein